MVNGNISALYVGDINGGTGTAGTPGFAGACIAVIMSNMKLVGNILWMVFGGFISGLAWLIAGVIWCVTVIGIPVGRQCFKLAGLSFCPFGKGVVYEGQSFSFIVNVFWFIISGIELAVCNFIFGCLLCITIIGIPFGKQFFKIAKLSMAPFGAVVTAMN